MTALPTPFAVLPTRSHLSDFASSPVVVTLFVVTLAFMAAASLAPTFGAALEGQTVGLVRGEVWRLFTYALTHNDWGHLAINLCLLFLFGPQLERIVGSGRFAAIYVASSVLAASFLFALFPGPGTTRGASAAVFGVLGALVAAHARPGGGLAAAAMVAIALLVASAISTIDGWGTLAGGPAFAMGVVVHALALLPGLALGLSLATSNPPRLLAVACVTHAVAVTSIAVGGHRRIDETARGATRSSPAARAAP